MRPWVLLLATTLSIAGAIAALRDSGREPQPWQTASAERARIERLIVASGTIEPENLVDVRPRVSGLVRQFVVSAGDHVRAGQVLAELDRETLHAAVKEARALLREARAKRNQMAADLSRHRALVADGLEARDTFDRAKTGYETADARVERAEATLERLEQELAYATITAPIDGVVLERPLNPGDAVASVASVTGGTVLMTIADTSRMHLKGVVDESEIAYVRTGGEARIRTETYGDRVFPGRVRKIAPIGTRKNNVTSFNVEVEVVGGVEDIWARMSAEADIVAEVREGVIVIPETALLYEGDGVAVEVVEGESQARFVRTAVRVGVASGGRVEIVDGLSDGAIVRLQ